MRSNRKTTVAGPRDIAAPHNSAAAPFNITTTLDTPVGTSGTATASLTTVTHAMRLASDGKIVIARYSSGNFAVRRPILGTFLHGTSVEIVVWAKWGSQF